MNIYNIAITLFLVANPIGNSPAIIALIKDFPFEIQRKIMIRETLFALLLALFFQYMGEIFLHMIHVKEYAVQLCGGILLLLVALNMILKSDNGSSKSAKNKEPLFVPIATPLVSGPGLLTIIMIYSQQDTALRVSLAIGLAWLGVAAVLISAPYLQRILHKSGLGALEQLMGMLLSMMSVEMIVQGLTKFIKVI